jgi:threonine synthase
MDDLSRSGSFTIAPHPLSAIRAEFAAGRADETEVGETIARVYNACGFLPDPHTAVGLAVARRYSLPHVPMVTLSTAHAAKFPDAVKAAAGIEPKLPKGFEGILAKGEEYATLANSPREVEDHILAVSRAARERV